MDRNDDGRLRRNRNDRGSVGYLDVTKGEQQTLAALAVVGVAAAYFILRPNGNGAAPGGPYAPILGTGTSAPGPAPAPATDAPGTPEPTILEQAAGYVETLYAFLTGNDEPTTPDPTKPKSPTQWRQELRPLFRRLETSYAMPTGFLEAVADRESRFRQDIIEGSTLGKSGEEGIMQLIPRYHLSNFAERTDPQVAIPYAANFLAKMFMEFGTWDEALAGYNWGPTVLRTSGLQAAPAATKEYIAWIHDRDYVTGFV